MKTDRKKADCQRAHDRPCPRCGRLFDSSVLMETGCCGFCDAAFADSAPTCRYCWRRTHNAAGVCTHCINGNQTGAAA